MVDNGGGGIIHHWRVGGEECMVGQIIAKCIRHMHRGAGWLLDRESGWSIRAGGGHDRVP